MEKDLKILERLIKRYYNIPCGNHICPTEIYHEEIEAIENLIDRNKELEEKINKLVIIKTNTNKCSRWNNSTRSWLDITRNK